MLYLVYRNGVSLIFFEDEGFQNVAGELGRKLTILTHREHTRNHLTSLFEEKKQKLRSRLNKKLFLVKMDRGTRLMKPYLAINVQYGDKKDIQE